MLQKDDKQRMKLGLYIIVFIVCQVLILALIHNFTSCKILDNKIVLTFVIIGNIFLSTIFGKKIREKFDIK